MKSSNIGGQAVLEGIMMKGSLCRSCQKAGRGDLCPDRGISQCYRQI